MLCLGHENYQARTACPGHHRPSRRVFRIRQRYQRINDQLEAGAVVRPMDF